MSALGGGSGALSAETCAGCHRAHTSSGAAAPSETLCLVCHSGSALGSTTNITDGVMAATDRSLKAGGFVNARMDSAVTGTSVSRPVTSAHGDAGDAGGTLWGSGAIGSGPGEAAVHVNCLSCHDPHGNGNYRILRPIPVDAAATADMVVTDEETKTYTVASASNRYFGQVYAGGNLTEQVRLDQWCAACHTRYDAPDPASGRTPSGDGTFRYRHTMRSADTDTSRCIVCHSPLDGAANPFQVNSAFAHMPVCESCHVAHGTAAQMGGLSAAVAYPDGSVPASGSARSSLLRLDNRGVCGGCHTP
jgi:predicted CXXCH cytochrome family protein